MLRLMRYGIGLSVLIACSFLTARGSAETLRLAVATNFVRTMETLARAYEAETDHDIMISSGSTGKLYAQIRHGAPYDIYFAADAARPKRLIEENLTRSERSVTYAVGQLTLWSPDAAMDLTQPAEVLRRGQFRRLAMANPALAPYGLATEQTLMALGGFDSVAGKLITAENIGMTYSLIASGNAELGFIARSQWLAHQSGQAWHVPKEMHAPIRQDAVILARSQVHEVAQHFIAYLSSTTARRIIRDAGYVLADDH